MKKDVRNLEIANDCYIIAPGPSINKQDLTLLEGKTIISLSSISRHDIHKKIPIKYHLLNRQTFHIEKGHNTENELVQNLIKLEIVLGTTTTLIADIDDKKLFEKYKLFENTKIIWRGYIDWNRSKITTLNINKIPSTRLLMESAIYIALYLGFDNIFTLGMDMDYICNGTESVYDTDKAKGSMNFLGEKKLKELRMWDAEFHLNRTNYTIMKFKVLYDYRENIYNLNANQNTFVDTFPLIKYEDLISKDNDKKKLLREAKTNFKKVPLKYTKLAFSSFFSFTYEKILSFSKDDKKYIIYGNGTFGKTIYKLMDEKIVSFIDKETKEIKDDYDYIIISVLGREDEIKNHLINKFDIDEEKIIIF